MQKNIAHGQETTKKENQKVFLDIAKKEKCFKDSCNKCSLYLNCSIWDDIFNNPTKVRKYFLNILTKYGEDYEDIN